MRIRSRSIRGNGFTLLEIMIVVSLIGLLAVIAIPSFVRARTSSEKNICLNNLREIDGAKQQWALENNKLNGDAPSNSDISQYLKGSQFPECPARGVYSVGNVGIVPVCNVIGHTY